MKILLISHSPLMTGGAERCLVEYTKVLIGMGHECHVILPARGEMSAVLTRVGVTWSTSSYIWATAPKSNQLPHIINMAGKSIAGILKIANKFSPDLIITNTVVIPWGAYVGKALGIPNALLVHETLSDNQEALGMEPGYSEYISNLNDNVDYVIFNSKYTKDDYGDQFDKPVVIESLLYPVPSIDAQIDDLYIENDIQDTLQIIMIGSIHKRKNQSEAVEAAKILLNKGVSAFHIDMYGDGDALYIKSLKKEIRDSGLERYISIKKHTHDIYRVLNGYNVVLSTFMYESFGRVVLEGQLFGRVVVTNSTGAGPELVRDMHNGLLYSIGDTESLAGKIEWIINNKAKAKRLGVVARREQRKKYMSPNRYRALEQMIKLTVANDSKGLTDRFNPVYSLSEYTNDLERRYRHLYMITHNRLTRTALHNLRLAYKSIYYRFK